MDEDWRNPFGILMCAGICDGASAGIYDGTALACCSYHYHHHHHHHRMFD